MAVLYGGRSLTLLDLRTLEHLNQTDLSGAVEGEMTDEMTTTMETLRSMLVSHSCDSWEILDISALMRFCQPEV